jgi:hypothetical protein
MVEFADVNHGPMETPMTDALRWPNWNLHHLDGRDRRRAWPVQNCANNVRQFCTGSPCPSALFAYGRVSTVRQGANGLGIDGTSLKPSMRQVLTNG